MCRAVVQSLVEWCIRQCLWAVHERHLIFTTSPKVNKKKEQQQLVSLISSSQWYLTFSFLFILFLIFSLTIINLLFLFFILLKSSSIFELWALLSTAYLSFVLTSAIATLSSLWTISLLLLFVIVKRHVFGWSIIYILTYFHSPSSVIICGSTFHVPVADIPQCAVNRAAGVEAETAEIKEHCLRVFQPHAYRRGRWRRTAHG